MRKELAKGSLLTGCPYFYGVREIKKAFYVKIIVKLYITVL